MRKKRVLICGFSKSGTTIIAKTFAHCVGLDWQNEIRSLWGISNYANLESMPDGSVASKVLKNEQWKNVKKIIEKTPIIKFPEGILILSLFPKTMDLVCIIRNPLDAICAYLERKHEFKTVAFSTDEIVTVAKDWNYHILSTTLIQRPILFVCYEEFVENPKKVIEQMASFCVLDTKQSMPDWISEQAQKYDKFVPGGQPIRGPGRYELSMRDKNIINKVMDLCRLSINYLKEKGIEYNN